MNLAQRAYQNNDISTLSIFKHCLINRHLFNSGRVAVEVENDDTLYFHHLGNNNSFREEPENLIGYFDYLCIEDVYPSEFTSDDDGDIYLTTYDEEAKGITVRDGRCYVTDWFELSEYVVWAWDHDTVVSNYQHVISTHLNQNAD